MIRSKTQVPGGGPFEVACCVALSDALVLNYLVPIALHPRVSKVWIVRATPVRRAEIPNSEFVLTPARTRPGRWWKMSRACARLAARPELRAFVSFNPIPYGLLASRAARRWGKAMHHGFIGADWYRYARTPWGRRVHAALRYASFFTATGESMRSEMIEAGFDGERIAVLPHGIDLEHFRLPEDGRREPRVVFVGQLIRRKRVDLLLEALAEVRRRGRDLRLSIVGEGPLREELERLAAGLGVAANVEFVGAVDDVKPHLERAKIIAIASDGEGFPFALAEGIACGLVPVSTPVGTVTDFLRDEENALLFPQGSAAALAECLDRLLSDRDLYARLRTGVLELREEFSYERAARTWDRWFDSLGDRDGVRGRDETE